MTKSDDKPGHKVTKSDDKPGQKVTKVTTMTESDEVTVMSESVRNVRR